MKIGNQQLVVNQANKTAKLQAFDGGAREFLKSVAADLVNTNGSVKSGYLRLNAGKTEVSINHGHVGSGATAATNLMLDLVDQAYGEQASQALKNYLTSTSGKGGAVGKIGTQSFVALIKKMEEGGPPEPVGSSGQKLSTAQLGNHRLHTRELQSLLARQPNDEQMGVKHSEPQLLDARKSRVSERISSALSNALEKNVAASIKMENLESEAALEHQEPIAQLPLVVRSGKYIAEVTRFNKVTLQPNRNQLLNILNSQLVLGDKIKSIVEAKPNNIEHRVHELSTWMKGQISPPPVEMLPESEASVSDIQLKRNSSESSIESQIPDDIFKEDVKSEEENRPESELVNSIIDAQPLGSPASPAPTGVAPPVVDIPPKSELIQLADQWLDLEKQRQALRQESLVALHKNLAEVGQRAQAEMSASGLPQETIDATLQGMVRSVSKSAVALNSIKHLGLPGIVQQDSEAPVTPLPSSVTRYPRWNRTTNVNGVMTVKDEHGDSWTNSKMLGEPKLLSPPVQIGDEVVLYSNYTVSKPRTLKVDAADGIPNLLLYRGHVYHLQDPSNGKFNAMLVQQSPAGIPAFVMEDASLELPAVNTYAKLDDAFPDANWKPVVKGYASNETGIHWVIEDLAPIRGIDDGILNFKLKGNRPARLAVMTDMAQMMTDLHEKGWGLNMDMHPGNLENIGVSVEGRLKLFGLPMDKATSEIQQEDIRQLAFQFLTTACENKYTGLLGNSEFSTSKAQWYPLNNKEALEAYVNFALLSPDEAAAVISGDINEETPLDPGSRFMDDAQVRQSAYQALGLGAYANWLERAINGAADGTNPATAAELTRLIKKNENPLPTDIGKTLRVSAEALNHPIYRG